MESWTVISIKQNEWSAAAQLSDDLYKITHYLLTIYSLSTHYLLTIYSLSTKYLFTIYYPSTHYLPSAQVADDL